MSVDVADDACLTTSCLPPWDLFSETISTAMNALTLSLSKGQRSRFDKLNVSAVDYCGGR
jgi:hypothetical protein